MCYAYVLCEYIQTMGKICRKTRIFVKLAFYLNPKTLYCISLRCTELILHFAKFEPQQSLQIVFIQNFLLVYREWLCKVRHNV